MHTELGYKLSAGTARLQCTLRKENIQGTTAEAWYYFSDPKSPWIVSPNAGKSNRIDLLRFAPEFKFW